LIDRDAITESVGDLRHGLRLIHADKTPVLVLKSSATLCGCRRCGPIAVGSERPAVRQGSLIVNRNAYESRVLATAKPAECDLAEDEEFALSNLASTSATASNLVSAPKAQRLRYGIEPLLFHLRSSGRFHRSGRRVPIGTHRPRISPVILTRCGPFGISRSCFDPADIGQTPATNHVMVERLDSVRRLNSIMLLKVMLLTQSLS
jgi:hypothetical protein